MATWQHELANPPAAQRARELWLQHVVGFILFEDIRRYAIEKINPALPHEARAAAQKGIEDALYGLMMVIDGETGGISNATHSVSIDFIARLAVHGGSTAASVVSEIDLRHGDGMCMGYHGWLAGDLGTHPVVLPRPATAS